MKTKTENPKPAYLPAVGANPATKRRSSESDSKPAGMTEARPMNAG